MKFGRVAPSSHLHLSICFPLTLHYLYLGQSSFPLISLLFRSNVPTVDAFAITQVPTEQIPEPLTILGAGTAAAFGAFFKRKLAKK